MRLQNQPILNQSIINQSIVKTSNAINLSGWMPQLSLSGTLVHYYQLPTTIIPSQTAGGSPTTAHAGMSYTFNPTFTASETIFDPQLLSSALKAPLNVNRLSKLPIVQKYLLFQLLVNHFIICSLLLIRLMF